MPSAAPNLPQNLAHNYRAGTWVVSWLGRHITPLSSSSSHCTIYPKCWQPSGSVSPVGGLANQRLCELIRDNFFRVP